MRILPIDEQDEAVDYTLETLVELREMLCNPLSPKSDFSEVLLETVDTALDKIINQTIIKNHE